MILRGKVVSFDKRTWWGQVSYDLEVLDFHGTCYRGFTGGPDYPYPGQPVDIILNSDHRLLSVESAVGR